MYVQPGTPQPSEPVEKFTVMLKEKNGTRRLPIWIGPAEAFAISSWLGGQLYSRPFSIDLAASLIRELGAVLERVAVTSHRESVFYARLVVDRQGHQLEIDARPSDAIAIALRLEAPIFVAEEVFAQGPAA